MSGRTCDLCGLGCGTRPLLQRAADGDRVFCCMGCMNVYLILSESGVIASGQSVRETEIFKRSMALGLIAQGDSETSARPIATPAAEPDASTRELLVQVSGMWCTACAWLIEHVLVAEKGVVAAQASFASDTVKVTYRPQQLPPQRVLERIQGLGYGAREYTSENNASTSEKRDLLLRLGSAAFLWANVMSLSLVIYAGYFEPISPSVQRYLPFILMALTTPVLAYCAAPIFRLAWRGLLHGAIRMEALLALGIGSAYFYSAIQAFRGGKHFYFDTVCVIVMLVLAGRLIEREAKAKATEWITNLYRLAPNKVRLLASGTERFVSVEALEVGTLFAVKAGERVPADGVVVEGSSHADESLLTGESIPIAKAVGDQVAAGSVNLDGVLQIQTLRPAGNSALARIIAQVENALSTRAPVERVVDKVSRAFVPSVIVFAIAAFGVLVLRGNGFETALMRSIAVLVIACPCALGLATPLAITSAMGIASRSGILISDSRVLETLQKLDVMVLDKTGTVTEGRFAVLGHEMAAGEVVAEERLVAAGSVSEITPEVRTAIASSRISSNEAIRLTASLEQYSEHPLSKALVAFALESSIKLSDATDVAVRKGQGITGVVEGHLVYVGNRRLFDELKLRCRLGFEKDVERWEQQGKTVTLYGWDNELHGVFAYGDQIRAESQPLVSLLCESGVEVRLVSGDSKIATEAVARELGCSSFRAEVLPTEKTAMIQDLQRRGKTVAMIGDGINDAPALAQADLGIAMGSGTDLAMRAAAVVLANGSLSRVPVLLRLSSMTMRVVRQNLFWAFFYNAAGIGLAVTGVLNPIFAAAAMLLSSASVIGNTLRLSKRADLARAR